jgi:hypothetical protein
MSWEIVSRELDTAEFLREENGPLSSPRVEELDEQQAAQVRAAHKVMKLLVKSGAVGEGKIRISASGHAHHDPVKMPTDPASSTFIGISIGRIP